MKRIIKLTALFAVLCITAMLVCSCAKGNITVSADKMLGKVTAYDGKSITVEIGANVFNNYFPGNMPGNMTPPDGMTPPDRTTPSDEATSSDDSGASGFVEEENRETGFGGGGFGDRDNGNRRNGAFLSTGVTAELIVKADVKITDASGNDVEIKAGDLVLLTLDSDMQVTAITLYEQDSEAIPHHK